MSGTPRIIRPGYPPLKWSDMEEAFRDINQNFNDIYATIMADGSTQVVNFSALYDDVSPALSNTYQLGSETTTWKKLYVSEYIDGLGNEDNGVWLGSAQLKGIGGTIDLPENSTINGELIFNPAKTFWSEIQVDSNLNLLPTSIGGTLDLNSGTAMQLVVDSSGGSITFNNTGVTRLEAGTGISLNENIGNVTVTNDGVTSLTNTTTLPSGRTTGTGIHVDNSTGDVKITNTGIIGITSTYGIILSTNTATGIATINWDPTVGVSSAFSRIHIDGDSILNDIQAGPSASTLTLVEGNGISFATDPVTDKLTISISRGDLVGSIFGDDSSKIVDAVESKVYAPNGFFGDITGNVNSSSGTSTFNNITVQGDLIVQGVTTSLETTNTQVTDNIIVLNNGEVGAGVTAGTSGFEVDRGSESNKTLLWNESVDKWTVGTETFIAGTFEGNLSGNVTGNVTGNLLGDVTGNVTGFHFGDSKGSVFGDDSAVLVDGIGSKLVGPVDNISVSTVNLFAQNFATLDSSPINVNVGVNLNSNVNIGGDILPTTASGGEIGSPDLVWNRLHLGSSVVIKGTSLSIRNGTQLTLNGVVVGGLGAITWNDITEKPIFATVAETGDYNDLLVKPTVLSNLTSIGFTTGTTVNEFSVDGTLADNSDDAVPTEKAVKTYVDGRLGSWNFTNNSVNSIDSSALSFSTAVQFNAAINVDEDVTIGGNLNASRIVNTEILNSLTLTQTYDKISVFSGSTGDVVHDLNLGSVFYHQSPASNFTPDIVNISETNSRVLSIIIFVEQGGTPYLPTALKIGGSSQTVQWANAAGVPTGNANQTDLVSFNLLRVENLWKVLGSLSTFG